MDDTSTQRQLLQRACQAVGLSPHGSVPTLLERLSTSRLPGRPGRKPKVASAVTSSNVSEEAAAKQQFSTEQRNHLAVSGITDFTEQTQIIERMWSNRQVAQLKALKEAQEAEGHEYTFTKPLTKEELTRCQLKLVRVKKAGAGNAHFVYRFDSSVNGAASSPPQASRAPPKKSTTPITKKQVSKKVASKLKTLSPAALDGLVKKFGVDGVDESCDKASKAQLIADALCE
jgi:hypothetical protein